MDSAKAPWLETLASACERVLASEGGDLTDHGYAAVREDVEQLLLRVRDELDELR